MNSGLTLLDLKPKATSFDVGINVEGGKVEHHTFHLRPFTIADEVWMGQNFPDHEQLVAAFQNIDMEVISKVAYNQLVTEDKKFLHERIRVIDFVDGQEVERAKDGHEKLMYAISGIDNQLALYIALMEARGISVPKNVEELADGKKPLPAASTRKSKTGQSWLIRLLRNMAGL